MPRRKKIENLTIDEQIAITQEKIESLKKELSEAESDLGTLTQKKEEQENEELIAIIKASGLSNAEISEAINSAKASSQKEEAETPADDDK